MDKLARMPSLEFEKYVKNVLSKCALGGGYALGCGNSVANYVKLENYLLMLKIGKYMEKISRQGIRLKYLVNRHLIGHSKVFSHIYMLQLPLL